MTSKKKDGRKGATSPAKSRASRENGKLGGRPRYVRLEIGQDIDQWERWIYAKNPVVPEVLRLDSSGAQIKLPNVPGFFGARHSEMKNYPEPGVYLLRPGIIPKWTKRDQMADMIQVEIGLLIDGGVVYLADEYEKKMEKEPGRKGKIQARYFFKQLVRDGRVPPRQVLKWMKERGLRGEPDLPADFYAEGN